MKDHTFIATTCNQTILFGLSDLMYSSNTRCSP